MPTFEVDTFAFNPVDSMPNVLHQSEFTVPVQMAPRIRINAVYNLVANMEIQNDVPTIIFGIYLKQKERARADIERALDNARSLLRFTKASLTNECMTLSQVCTMANDFGICTQNILMRDELTTMLSARIGTECAICKDEFEPDQWLLKTHCNHCFHDKCLETWIETQLNDNHSVEIGTCPLCILALDNRPEAKKVPLRRSMRDRVTVRRQFHPYSR